MKLFDKKGTKMTPTEFADDLYKELVSMRDSASSLRLKFENLHEGNSGHLNIAVGVALQSSQGFVDLISNINSNFPNVSLNISSMIKDTCLPLLKDGEIDLWIGDIGDLTNDDQLIKKFIKKIPLVLYANKNNQVFNKKKLSLPELKNQITEKNLTCKHFLTFKGSFLIHVTRCVVWRRSIWDIKNYENI